MSDAEAEKEFREFRWADTEGEPVCPHCGGLDAYECRRPNGSLRFRCRACAKDFTITSGTLFHSHKMPLRNYLAAVAIFCNEVKGKSALALSRDLGTSYKAIFVLLHKIREAIGSEIGNYGPSGEVEIDGCYVGGYVRPANRKEDRKDRRLRENQSGKRRAVVVMRERSGRTLTAVYEDESAAVEIIRTRVKPGSTIHADEAPAWDVLHAHFDIKRINHRLAYSDDGACTNWAESFFSRLRRAEVGIHHHISGKYLGSYASEMAWREDFRRTPNGMQYILATRAALAHPQSQNWKRYWRGKEE